MNLDRSMEIGGGNLRSIEIVALNQSIGFFYSSKGFQISQIKISFEKKIVVSLIFGDGFFIFSMEPWKID